MINPKSLLIQPKRRSPLLSALLRHFPLLAITWHIFIIPLIYLLPVATVKHLSMRLYLSELWPFHTPALVALWGGEVNASDGLLFRILFTGMALRWGTILPFILLSVFLILWVAEQRYPLSMIRVLSVSVISLYLVSYTVVWCAMLIYPVL